MAYEIKRNDRRPHWRVGLTANGSPADLTGAVGATFTMATPTGTVVVNKAAATIVTPASGIVEYAWGATDTSASGDFNAEVEIDWGGGEKQSFPSKGFFMVTISDDLA